MVLLLKWTWQHRALDKNVNGYDVWENVQENSSLIEKHFVGIGTALFITKIIIVLHAKTSSSCFKKLSFDVVDRFLDLWVTTYKDKNLK